MQLLVMQFSSRSNHFIQIVSSATCSQTPLVHVPPSLSETILYSHRRENLKSYKSNFDLLLSLPNILTVTLFQTICFLFLWPDFVPHSCDETLTESHLTRSRVTYKDGDSVWKLALLSWLTTIANNNHFVWCPFAIPPEFFRDQPGQLTPGACLGVLGRTSKRTSNHDSLRYDLLSPYNRNVNMQATSCTLLWGNMLNFPYI
jgi:hypothetical protein